MAKLTAGRYQVTGDNIVSSHHRTLAAAVRKAKAKAGERIGLQPKRVRVIDKETMKTVFSIRIPSRVR